MEKIVNISDVTQCPVCKKKNLKRVLVHIERSKSCKAKCPKDVLEALKEKSKKLTIKNRAEIMSLQRQENPEKIKKNERERQQKCRIQKKEKDNEMEKKSEALVKKAQYRKDLHRVLELVTFFEKKEPDRGFDFPDSREDM